MKPSSYRLAHHQWLIVALVAVAAYVLLPQLGSFRDSLTLLQQASLPHLAEAGLLTASTFLAAAATYCLLALKPLSYRRTLLIEVAATFVNRLLPAGIGGIGANYDYLRKSRHTSLQAASVVTANNLLGLIGHLLLTAGLLVIYHKHLASLRWSHQQLLASPWKWLVIGGLAAVIVGLMLWPKLRRRLGRGLQRLGRQLLAYHNRPLRLAAALGTSMALTMGNVGTLWLCALALHASLSLVTCLVIFTLGLALGTATPTPGGIGGIEAGLLAGLVAFHVSSAPALAIVLLFRLVNNWLVLVVGAAVFAVVRHRRYL